MLRAKFLRGLKLVVLPLILPLLLPSLCRAQEARYFDSTQHLGRVILLAQAGEEEAEALQSWGYDCTLLQASQVAEVSRQIQALNEPGPGFILVALKDSARLAAALASQASYPLAGCVLVDPQLSREAVPERFSPGSPPLLVVSKTSDSGVELLLERVRAAGSGAEIRQLEGQFQLRDTPAQKAIRRFLMAHSALAPLGLKGVPFVASPNWDVRSLDDVIDTVVVHATVINTMEGTQRAFLDDKVRRVSAHYVVDRDGSIVQMVDERCTAWHAGVSELDGRSGVNEFSIGVELVNLNDGVDPYPPAQMEALARIIRDLRNRRQIPDERIVSHAQIARPVGRKSDPLGFDFARLYQLLTGK